MCIRVLKTIACTYWWGNLSLETLYSTGTEHFIHAKRKKLFFLRYIQYLPMTYTKTTIIHIYHMCVRDAIIGAYAFNVTGQSTHIKHKMPKWQLNGLSHTLSTYFYSLFSRVFFVRNFVSLCALSIAVDMFRCCFLCNKTPQNFEEEEKKCILHIIYITYSFVNKSMLKLFLCSVCAVVLRTRLTVFRSSRLPILLPIKLQYLCRSP